MVIAVTVDVREGRAAGAAAGCGCSAAGWLGWGAARRGAAAGLSADAALKAFRVVGSRDRPGTKIIEVAYNCHVSGVARLALHLEMQPTLPSGKVEPTRALTMSWEKICQVPAVRGLNVKMVQPAYHSRNAAQVWDAKRGESDGKRDKREEKNIGK